MRWPGRTCSRLVPRLEIWFCTASVAPLPSVTMVITALTPITMPRIVRNERSRLRRIERRASSRVLSSIRRPRSAVVGGSRGLVQAGGVRVGCVVGHHAIHEMHDAPGIRRHVGFVRDHQHGDAVVHVEAPQQVHDLAAALGVEVAGGLVGQQHGRLGDDGAGDRHALLLSARQFGRRVVLPALEADGLQRLGRCGVACGGRLAAVEQRQLHVLLRRGARQQVEALEHEAEVPAPQPRALVA